MPTANLTERSVGNPPFTGFGPVLVELGRSEATLVESTLVNEPFVRATFSVVAKGVVA